MEDADFSGYASKASLKCTDGRIIMPNAFKHMDKMQVPLVWNHGHKDVENVLGHAVLEARDGHLYAHGFFNPTKAGQTAKALVQHGDIKALSIYANRLQERQAAAGLQVQHGMVTEVSLVYSRANPGAEIDFVNLKHSDGSFTELDDEAIIHSGEEFTFVVEDEDFDGEAFDDLEHADGEMTIADVVDSMNEEQKTVLYFMVAEAKKMDSSAAQSDQDEKTLAHQEGNTLTMNVFENQGGAQPASRHVMTRDDVRGIIRNMIDTGRTLKHCVEEYATEHLAHGIDDIDLLFPDAKSIEATPQWDKRRTEWVAGVLSGTSHVPWAKIKSRVADITLDEARAKGYVTGELKKEEWFSLSQRTTGPTTIYKKQKLDRDNILDITEFDVVAWMKAEMRMMLEEELAGAILVGDGRAVDDDDKVKDPAGVQDGIGIRSILNDHQLYTATLNVNVDDANSNYLEVVEAIMRGSHLRKGTGKGNFYTTQATMVELLLSKDTLGRRHFNSPAELALALGVNEVIPVEIMERETDVLGIIVNLADYSIGTNRGGEVSFFDDFNIDYNKFIYLYETRLSGALTMIRSALVVKKVASTDVLVTPNAPTFVSSTGVITIVATTGVTYHYVQPDGTSGSALTAGAQTALAAGVSATVRAVAATNYYLKDNINEEWTFTRDDA
jgi:phage head maturation protease